ncbi:MAG: electron transfer flavoprotein subunit beta/FixA family protein [Synergistetes bacterium]|nr:electron transfer flavoprotein subunit beta/FixA family protein [Synergistota bacterium]
MRICVLVKQVPATDKVKMDEKTGTMIRSEMEAELNPLDMYAVEEAVRVKERLNGEADITVISMGPRMAIEAIKDAISMGCDRGYLLSDRLLAGSDTLATAYALAKAIEYLGGFDIIFTGERATDGETGQVGPSVASQLDLIALTYVSKIEEIGNGYIRVQRAIEGGHEVVETDLPVLISVVKEINEPRIPNLAGKLRAKEAEIPILTAEDLNLDRGRIGLDGSPTRVVRIFYPKLSRSGKIVDGKDPEKAVEELISFLEEKEIL